MMMFLLTGLLFLFPWSAESQQQGFKYSKYFSFRDYEHQPQNWGFVQAKNGIMYVANQGGVLEYDGNAWRVIKVPRHASEYQPVRSLAIDDQTGTIYVGGKNELGYLEADKHGLLEYVSLLLYRSDKLPRFCSLKLALSFPLPVESKTR